MVVSGDGERKGRRNDSEVRNSMVTRDRFPTRDFEAIGLRCGGVASSEPEWLIME
jgi:hypothetical protein